jgi:hypothetical protein
VQRPPWQLKMGFTTRPVSMTKLLNARRFEALFL